MKTCILNLLFLTIFFLPVINMEAQSAAGYYKSEKLLSKVQKKFNKELNKYHLEQSGSGGSSDINGIIKLVNVTYNLYKGPISKEEGRKLLILCLEKYLELINSDKEIQPFLKNYPFTDRNFHLAIFCYSADGENLYEPYIYSFASYSGRIYYELCCSTDEFKFTELPSETYEEALQIVKNEKSENKK